MAGRISIAPAGELDSSATVSEPVTFGLDGARYEIELSPDSAALLRATLERWITFARPIGLVSKPVTGTVDARAVRQWAAERNFPVHIRGRLSRAVIHAFVDAHEP